MCRRARSARACCPATTVISLPARRGRCTSLRRRPRSRARRSTTRRRSTRATTIASRTPEPSWSSARTSASTKTPDAATVSAGGRVGFLLTVANAGPGRATGVTLRDTLPSSAGLAWSIDGGTGAGQCAIAGGVLSCDFGTLASGASRTVHISSPTTAATCGTIDNTAIVDPSNDDPVSGSGTVVVQCPDLSVVKTADAGSVSAGSPIGFSITVSNAGPGTASGVTLNDTLPVRAWFGVVGGAGCRGLLHRRGCALVQLRRSGSRPVAHGARLVADDGSVVRDGRQHRDSGCRQRRGGLR